MTEYQTSKSETIDIQPNIFIRWLVSLSIIVVSVAIMTKYIRIFITTIAKKLKSNEQMHDLLSEQSKIIGDIKHRLDLLSCELNINSLHESIRSGNNEHTKDIISHGCMYNDETILLLLQYGNYELYKFWCEHGLVINHHIVCATKNHFDKDMNIYHNAEWFDDVVSKLLDCECSHNYIRTLILECLHYCDDSLFTGFANKHLNYEIFESEHLNVCRDGQSYYHKKLILLCPRDFMIIYSNDHRLEFIINKIGLTVRFDEPIVDDKKIIEKVIKSKMQCMFGSKYRDHISELEKEHNTHICLRGTYYLIPTQCIIPSQ